ncbi:MAG: SIMPL domain-containing protein [Rhizobiaceae bacterium]
MNHLANFALCAAVAASSVPGSAQAESPKPGTISISATGTATAVPDMAMLNLSIVREAETARQALDANSTAMAEVLAELKNAGIEDRDLQTSNFNIQPRYHYPKSNSDGQRPPKIVGYTVSNGLTVRIRQLDSVGSILDKSVSLRVNRGGAITFLTEEPKPVIEEARKKAVAAALAKAKTLSDAADVELGRILEISEQDRRSPRPRQMMMRADAAAESAPVVPIAAGENTYSITVNVKWELAQD